MVELRVVPRAAAVRCPGRGLVGARLLELKLCMCPARAQCNSEAQTIYADPTFTAACLRLSGLEGQSARPAATASTMRKGPPVLITVLSRKPAAFKSPSS